MRVRKRSLIVMFSFLILLGMMFVALAPYSSVPVVHAEGEPVYYRGSNYETWTYINGSVKQVSASQYVWNETDWVAYIFQDLYASEGKYVIQTGCIGAEIYDYYAKFYAPCLCEVRVYDERWEIQKWKTTGGGKWDDIGAQSGTPTYTVLQYDEGVNITKAFHSWAGWFNITYVFRSSLKHDIVFSSEIASSEIFRVIQQWSGIVGTRVKHESGTTEITCPTKINGTYFEFLKVNDELSVLEHQWAMKQYLDPVTVDVHAQGMKCDFIFSNWTLTNGERLIIDPTTETLFVDSFDSTYTEWDTSGTSPYIDDSTGYIYTDVNDEREGNFGFADIAGSVQSLTSVEISCQVKALAANLQIDVFVYNGSWNNVGALTGITNIFTYKTIDISSTLDTVSKINNTDVYFQADLPTAYRVYIQRAKLVVIYTPTPDTEPPTYSDVGTDTTDVRSDCVFHTKWVDNVSMNGYIFGANYSHIGVWYNDSWIESTGTPVWTNITKELTSEVGQKVAWCIWTNDTSGNWNNTGTQSFLTTGSGIWGAPSTTPSWISPTGHDTSTWSSEENIYDNDTTTVSTGGPCSSGGLSSFVYLDYYYDIQCNKLRFYASASGTGCVPSDCKLDVDVLKDGSWVDLHYDTWTHNAWIEKSFTEGVVTRTRIRAYVAQEFCPCTFSIKEIQFWGWAINVSIGQFQAPSTVYPYQHNFINVTIHDPQGNTTFKNATIGLMSANYTWTNSTNTFSETTSQTYMELNTTGSSRIYVNSTSFKLRFKIRFFWNATEGTVDVWGIVYDEDDNTDTHTHSSLFTFEDDLIVYTSAVNDTRINPSQGIRFNGTLYYQGTTISPVDTSEITAKVELSGAEKGSNATIDSTGNFSISISGESSYANHSYNIYAITDQNTEQNQTGYVVVDKVVVTISADSYGPDTGTQVNFTVIAIYNYDSLQVGTCTINIYRNSTHYDSGNFTDTQAGAVVYNYTVENVTETTYDLTDFTSNTITIQWGELIIEIYGTSTVDNRIDVSTNASISFHCRFSINQSDCATGTLTVNGTGYSINATGWATLTPNFTTVDSREYEVTAVNVNGETDYQQMVSNPSVIWDRVDVVTYSAWDSRINLNKEACFYFTLKYEHDDTTISSGSITLNGSLSLNWIVERSRWEYNVTKTTSQSLTVYVVSLTGNTHNITALNSGVSSDMVSIMWDELDMSSFVYGNGTEVDVAFLIESNYSNATALGTLTINTYIDGSLHDTNTVSWTDASTTVNFTISQLDYSSGTLSFNVTDTDGVWNNDTYSCTYSIGITGHSAGFGDADRGDTITFTTIFTANATINGTSIWLDDLFIGLEIHTGDAIWIDAHNYTLFNSTTGINTHDEDYYVDLPAGTYTATMSLYYRASDNLLDSYADGFEVSIQAGTGGGGGGGAPSIGEPKVEKGEEPWFKPKPLFEGIEPSELSQYYPLLVVGCISGIFLFPSIKSEEKSRTGYHKRKTIKVKKRKETRYKVKK